MPAPITVFALLLLATAAAAARAEVYTCVDKQGRHLTADRPILDCIDREQVQIAPSGAKKKVEPSLTAEERSALEEKARRDAEARNRALDQRRQDRALLLRYPDRAAHDKERESALSTVEATITTSSKVAAELVQQRQKLASEMEFYARNPKKAPARLVRQIEENEQQQAAQKRYVATQQEEKQRINQRYDRELARLATLWAATQR